jgi:hypothetical protein
MSIRKIIRLNALLVLSIGIYGILTDEPYWRAVGHDPGLYDYFFWFGLVLNGPSGFAADYAARLIAENLRLNWQALIQTRDEWQFVVQYALWLLLLWPQWKGYDLLARWYVGRPGRETSLRLAAVAIVLIGCVGAYENWTDGHRIGLFFIDRYFWVVRSLGLGLSGLVVLSYGQLLTKDGYARR